MDAISFTVIWKLVLVVVATFGVTILLKRFLRSHFLPKIGIPIGTREAISIIKLIDIGYRKRLKAGDVLYREGDPRDAFYIILFGSVEYYVEKLNQTPTVLNRGEFVGELSLMLGLRRTVTVRAREETTLFAINKDGFATLLKEQPHLYELIVVELGKAQKELSQQQKQLQELGLLNYRELDKNPVVWVRYQLEKLFNR